ncbi:MAG: hypothetical protein RJA61_546 [Candidatus Parcubacteria bacterium]|jgi:uncharacterized membrane protein YuzA (DUF378 family)
MFKHKFNLTTLAWLLVVIGAINWGILGLSALFGKLDVNVVAMILEGSSTLEAIVYVLVGIAGIKVLFDGCNCDKCRV